MHVHSVTFVESGHKVTQYCHFKCEFFGFVVSISGYISHVVGCAVISQILLCSSPCYFSNASRFHNSVYSWGLRRFLKVF